MPRACAGPRRHRCLAFRCVAEETPVPARAPRQADDNIFTRASCCYVLLGTIFSMVQAAQIKLKVIIAFAARRQN